MDEAKPVFTLIGEKWLDALKECSLEFTLMACEREPQDEVRRVVFEIEQMPDEEDTLS
jgi:hypothetical protein